MHASDFFSIHEVIASYSQYSLFSTGVFCMSFAGKDSKLFDNTVL